MRNPWDRKLFAEMLHREFSSFDENGDRPFSPLTKEYKKKNDDLNEEYIYSLIDSISSYIIGSFNDKENEKHDEVRHETIKLLKKAVSQGFTDEEVDELPEHNAYKLYGVYAFFSGDEDFILPSLKSAVIIKKGETWQPPREEEMARYKAICKEVARNKVEEITDYALLKCNTRSNATLSFVERHGSRILKPTSHVGAIEERRV